MLSPVALNPCCVRVFVCMCVCVKLSWSALIHTHTFILCCCHVLFFLFSIQIPFLLYFLNISNVLNYAYEDENCVYVCVKMYLCRYASMCKAESKKKREWLLIYIYKCMYVCIRLYWMRVVDTSFRAAPSYTTIIIKIIVIIIRIHCAIFTSIKNDISNRFSFADCLFFYDFNGLYFTVRIRLSICVCKSYWRK